MRELCRIPVGEDTLCYLQQLSFELDGLRALNCQIACSETAKMAWYRRYLRAYEKKSAAYHFAFAELVKTLAPECARRENRSVVDFYRGELICYEEDKAHAGSL